MNDSITKLNQLMSTFVAHQDPFTTYVGWIEDGTKISPWDVTAVGEKTK
ncbi:hypothetical protein CGLO_17880 [Colletotrichum gloeosporioides Cg-14]|uniref:Uncharacterized protein n=1 Tax=Colletotrichum gloeosporioides (strain Cg-14) TaxID=1237896 RepID=T0L5F0_COLGC|nr:hypothetical protein CGLO_17880 [Colletotrichum gloeosporioides Cg-14]